MTKVWVTRTWPASEDSLVAWRAAGFDPVADPLLEIEAVTHEPIPTDAVVVFTSKNGVDHATCGGQRAVCVGDATATKARRAGYVDVVSVDGTSSDITRWICENLPKSQAIYHASGWHVRGNVAEALAAAGYKACRVKTYRSVPRPIWPDIPFTRVVLYSPLAASVFASLCEMRDPSHLTAVCISQATADELSALNLQSIMIAARPREDELIMAAKSA